VQTGDWRTLEAGMSASNRKSVQRKRKIAQRDGVVRFEIVSPDETNVATYLNEVFRIEAACWKGRAGTAVLMDRRQHRFYQEFGYRAAALGILRLFFLNIGDSRAAARVAIEYADRLWELKIGYDERFAKCSPGILLTHDTLRYACEKRLVGHEFLGRADKWQQHWPLEFKYNTTARFYPKSIGGAFALTFDSLEFGSRRLFRG
jgi:CelD/BcsL family acetyltransferase involved in cellulose biosynthesis